MKPGWRSQVGPILREVAEEAILPRFRRLAETEVREKTPGEIVTIADRHAEALLAERLVDLYPGSRVVGEEACAASPGLLERLDEGAVWLVDPLDGTGNFVAGRGPFAVMAALLISGETVGSWMYAPLSRRLCEAELGGGALVDGRRVRTDPHLPSHEALIGAALSRFMPPQIRERIEAASSAIARLTPGLSCAGAEYPAVARGDRHFALFWRTLAWDHAPGALFLREAGGSVTRWDGSAYLPATPGEGLLIAHNREVADEVARRVDLATAAA
jgi:fructose-1,6-bisphosphatase/inositol monophosphatase family enzyme